MTVEINLEKDGEQRVLPFEMPDESLEQPATSNDGATERSIEETIALACVDKLSAKLQNLNENLDGKSKLKDELLRKDLDCEAILEILRK